MNPSQSLIKNAFIYSDGKLLWRHGSRSGKRAGCRNQTTGYWQIVISGKYYSGHVLIWIYHNGEIPKGYIIDHKDEDKSNDNIENLRLATRSQNGFNRKKENSDSFTGFKGVSFDKRRNHFYARIKVNNSYK